MTSLHQTYFDIQNKFSKKEISFEEYSQQIIEWNNDFNNLIKSKQTNIVSSDPSKGGRLVKKQITDKTGKKITKWVKPNEIESNKTKKNDQSDSIRVRQEESNVTIEQWKNSVSKASQKALENASKYATNLEVKRMAKDELLKRSVNLNKFMDMSLFPDFMLNDYVSRYGDVKISTNQNKAISEYRDLKFEEINSQLRDGNIDSENKNIVKNIDAAIQESELKNDIVLHRGISGKKAALFINNLKSLQPGDVFEDFSYTSTSLVQSQAIKFKELYKSTNNLVLKIYASKGQNALSMQNLGSEDDKIMYNDEYEFLLPRNSKFQIIEQKDNEISVKLL